MLKVLLKEFDEKKKIAINNLKLTKENYRALMFDGLVKRVDLTPTLLMSSSRRNCSLEG